MLTMLQERVHDKKAAAAVVATAAAAVVATAAAGTTSGQDKPVATALVATAATGATAPRRRIMLKTNTQDKNAQAKNVASNGGPPAGAAPIVFKLGCSKCRGGSLGCIQCRNPNFKGKRFTAA
jgi:hypothetical protein